MEELLSVKHLNVGFLVKKKQVNVLNDVTFDIAKGEVLGVIGETGCGKSVTGNAVLHLLPDNSVKQGEIFYKGQEILHMHEKDYIKLRGEEISAIPQSPATSLNPMMKVGKQVAECVTAKDKSADKDEVKKTVTDIFERLHLPRHETMYSNYPWELSGGMCQRVLIGMGMITHAHLLVIDEPTKAIDWSLRKSVSDILHELKEQMGCSMLMITHDIPVASSVADRVAVMYCGEIIEIGPTKEVLHKPVHPYTQGLVASMPANGFKVMEGFMPPFSALPQGCNFIDRCPYKTSGCEKDQAMADVGEGHSVRCFRCTGKVKEADYAVGG